MTSVKQNKWWPGQIRGGKVIFRDTGHREGRGMEAAA